MINEKNLGPAERVIQTLLAYSDHLFHGRPGVVSADPTSVTGSKWVPAVWKLEDGVKVAYRKDQTTQGKKKKTVLVRLGALQADYTIPGVGRFMNPGLYKEVAVWMYRQIAEIWNLDNEFAARWASYAYAQDHRDIKVALAAFMLVQSRKGDPVLDNGKVAFHDEDFRDVGEAMILLDGAKYLDLKAILRIQGFLELPEIAAINRELGFGNSARNAFLGRFPKVAEKWLRYREENPKMLEGLVKKGFRSSVKKLAELIGYRPTTPKFFKILRWKQTQAKDGRRSLVIGEAVKAAESWAGLTEEAICERIIQLKPDLKRLVGMLPEEVGLTRAVMAAAIEAQCLSNKDLIIYTPTLEELGLLKIPAIQARWQHAVKAAEDQRSINIASRVKSQETKDALKESGDAVVQKIVEEVLKNLRIYFIVDISSSMNNSIEKAKEHLSKFVSAFPLDKIHVSVFNTSGREIVIKHASAAGVTNAFAGIKASGGTAHGSGVLALKHHKPAADEDALFIFVGDEEEYGTFTEVVRVSGLNPMAFGLLKVRACAHTVVQSTAAELGIPCFNIDERTFADPYAIPRTIRALVAATPVGVTKVAKVQPRVTLVDTILKTELLKKPTWAEPLVMLG